MNRIFSLGSEWVYFKIYSGYKIADILLLEYLSEKIKSLQSGGYIKKWFFIRYNDPDSHLRIRFQVSNIGNVFHLIYQLTSVFQDLLDKNFIWNVQIDTYLREIERYGIKVIEDSESLFCFDSEMILDYLSLKNSFENDETQLLFSFLSINSFLNNFALSTSEKLVLLDDMQKSFKMEFNATKVLKNELDKHYRSLKNEISSVMNDSSRECYQIVDKRSQSIKPIVKSIKEKLEVNLNSFLSSHIHMMINRQFTSRQREYETLIYDHLFRYYKTCVFRSKFSNKALIGSEIIV